MHIYLLLFRKLFLSIFFLWLLSGSVGLLDGWGFDCRVMSMVA